MEEKIKGITKVHPIEAKRIQYKRDEIEGYENGEDLLKLVKENNK